MHCGLGVGDGVIVGDLMITFLLDLKRRCDKMLDYIAIAAAFAVVVLIALIGIFLGDDPIYIAKFVGTWIIIFTIGALLTLLPGDE